MTEKKVIPLEDRLPKLKQERRQKANRRFVFYAAVFFILVLIIVYFQSPLSKVSHVDVSGEHYTSRAAIIKQSGLSNRPHYWDADVKAISRRVERLPFVKSAAVKRHFPNRVTIRVQEYSRKAYLEENGAYYPIMENGTMLAKLPKGQLPVDAPVLIGFKHDRLLRETAEGLAHSPQNIIHSISDIHLIHDKEEDGNLVLYMNDGNRVLASTATFAKNMAAYPSIAKHLPKNKRGTIHLSMGAYFEPDDSKKAKK